jgi:hypothetical protein
VYKETQNSQGNNHISVHTCGHRAQHAISLGQSREKRLLSNNLLNRKGHIVILKLLIIKKYRDKDDHTSNMSSLCFSKAGTLVAHHEMMETFLKGAIILVCPFSMTVLSCQTCFVKMKPSKDELLSTRGFFSPP